MNFKILQMTDFHITGDTSEIFNTSTQASLEYLLQHTKRLIQDSDVLFHTGDLSQDGSINSYKKIVSALSFIKKNIFWIPGNHDNLENMRLVFDKEANFHFGDTLQLGQWHFIFLNTQLLGNDEGYLSDEAFVFLEQQLKADNGFFKAIVMHHHPIKVNTPLVDHFILKNHPCFLKLIKKYSVPLIISGHVHGNYSVQFGKTRLETSPATCFQFISGAKALAVDFSMGCKLYCFSGPNFVSETMLVNRD